MAILKIKGGNPLNGTIKISGAKNATLPLLCASLLTKETLIFKNSPNNIADVKVMADLLGKMGSVVKIKGSDKLEITTNKITNAVADYDLVSKMRASILVLGALLARNAYGEVAMPGGCNLGDRSINLHIEGLKKLGATIELTNGVLVASAKNGLKGAKIKFNIASVGATTNIILAACLAKGTTILSNAAKEPEIMDLVKLLNKMGAKIKGAGTSTITIEGVKKLTGAKHSIIPDRIEAISYIIAVIATKGKATITNINIDHIKNPLVVLKKIGANFTINRNSILVKSNSNNNLKPIAIETAIYPGYPTDGQAQIMALLSLVNGVSTINENIFDSRFGHVAELSRMGANIKTDGKTAVITGVKKLYAAPVVATDLRASFALVIAALATKGKTVISEIHHLERGYETIVKKLQDCGADIKKID